MGTPKERLHYLREVLALDPEEATGQILELRRARREGPKRDQDPSSLTTADPAQRRAQAEATVQGISETFWDDESDPAKALEALRVAEYPDLERWASRLRKVATIREQVFDALAEDSMDANFHEVLTLVLVAPEQDRLEHRRRTLRALSQRSLRGPARRSAKLIGRHYPEIDALEPQWLDDVRNARRYLREAGPARGIFFGLGVYMALRVLVYVVKKWTGDE